MAQKKKHAVCGPTPAARRGTLAAIENRIKAAVGYDMKKYVPSAKEVGRKNKRKNG